MCLTVSSAPCRAGSRVPRQSQNAAPQPKRQKKPQGNTPWGNREPHIAPALQTPDTLAFSRPDYTVGPGLSPDLQMAFQPSARGLGLIGHTAGRGLDGDFPSSLCPEGAACVMKEYSTVALCVKCYRDFKRSTSFPR